MWTWVIIGFVVLQAVVGGLAKAAEKRKKAEAAARREGRPVPSNALDRGDTAQKLAKFLGVEIETTQQDPARPAEEPPRRPVAGLPGGQGQPPRPANLGSVTAEESGRDLRRRRIEALRRRQAAVGKKPAIPPPPVATPPVTPSPVPAKRSSPETRAKASSPPRPKTEAAATPTAKAPAVTPRAYRKSSTGPLGGTSLSMQGSRASRLRPTMRNPRTMREAILVAELIRTPVALRPVSDQGM